MAKSEKSKKMTRRRAIYKRGEQVIEASGCSFSADCSAVLGVNPATTEHARSGSLRFADGWIIHVIL